MTEQISSGYQLQRKLPLTEANITCIDNSLQHPTAYILYNSGNSERNETTFFYISDIHLLHHINPDRSIREQVQAVAKSLHNQIVFEASRCPQYFMLFGGDVPTSSEITKYFFHYFSLLFQFDGYKKWKRRKVIETRIEFLNTEKEKYLKKYRKWKKYTSRHEEMNEERLVNLIRKDKSAPEFLTKIAIKIKKIEYELKGLREENNHLSSRVTNKSKFEREMLPIFVILGNHELNDFRTVDEAVSDYSAFFVKEKIHFLHNSSVKIPNFDILWSFSDTIILGGIGFAKYNEQYNANNICTTNPPLSREEEIKQTDLFLKAYNDALEDCIKNDNQLIVLSHYPPYSWLPDGQFHSRCVYFYGHDHRNTEIHDGGVNIFANNQIGYHTKEIAFKQCHMGTYYNPFVDYEDGCFPITVDQYYDFYRFNNDGGIYTNNLRKRTQDGDTLYMIKKDGYYGFFLVACIKDVYICNGGRLKRIKNVSRIEHCEKYFTDMVNKYVNALWPYRKAQNQISEELKSLGFSGAIHGCIIDIDFYNHIMLNPQNGEMSCYYSPTMGYARCYNSFDEFLLNYLQDRRISSGCVLGKEKLLQKWNEIKPKCALAAIDQKVLPSGNNELSEDFVSYVGSHGMYDISRKMNSFQRLFDSRILREWDESLIGNK